MNPTEYGKVIAKNLKRIAYEHQKTQAEIARDLNISPATLSSWMVGTRVPRMSKIDLLCHYFNCTRADIMEVKEPGEMGRAAARDSLLLVEISRTVSLLSEEGKQRLLAYAQKLLELEEMENA